MTLWFVLALMTAAAIFAVLWPLRRRAPRPAGSDVAVYRDQLEEIDRDRAAGLIGEREAEAARVEVSRRLIAAADGAAPAPAAGAERRRRAAALAALVLLPVGAAALYLTFGSPQLPGQPQAARRDAPLEERSIETLVARVEAHLETNPEDGRGWEVVGPVYMRLGRFDDAVKARRNVLRLLGANAVREADLGEALTGRCQRRRHRRGQGGVRARAGARCRRSSARAISSALPPSRTAGRGEAAEIWRGLLASAPTDAPWVEFVRQSLARVDPNAASPRPEQDQARVRAPRMSPRRAQIAARAARRHGPRHGGAAGRAAEQRRLRRRGMAAACARLYGAGRPRQGGDAPPPMRAARSPASRTSCAASRNWSKAWG